MTIYFANMACTEDPLEVPVFLMSVWPGVQPTGLSGSAITTLPRTWHDLGGGQFSMRLGPASGGATYNVVYDYSMFEVAECPVAFPNNSTVPPAIFPPDVTVWLFISALTALATAWSFRNSRGLS